MRTNLWSARYRRTAGRAQTISQCGPDLLAAQESAISQLIGMSRPWSRERVSLPQSVRRLLWFLIGAQLAWAVWLITMIATGTASCAGPVCTVATLDGRVVLLLVCSVLSLTGLGFVAVVTRGLSSTDCRETAGLTLSVAAGGVALLGVAALLCVIAIILLIFAVLFGTMTFTP